MTFTIRKTALGLAVAATTALTAVSAHAVTNVDLELALLVDVSGSIVTTEFETQRDGYEAAFRSQAVKDAIAAGTYKSIAVTMMYWSGTSQQATVIDWTEINDAASAEAFADAIALTTRQYFGSTAPGSALNKVTPEFAANLFNGTRNVIDVSGDGAQNAGADTATARDAALNAGVDAINGIYIGDAALGNWYDDNIVGGTNAFSIQATNFSTFGNAVQKKLVGEIIDQPPTVPLPAPALMLIAGLGALGTAARKRKKA